MLYRKKTNIRNMENYEDLILHLGLGKWNYLMVLFASWRSLLGPGQYMIGSFIHPSLNTSCNSPPSAILNASYADHIDVFGSYQCAIGALYVEQSCWVLLWYRDIFWLTVKNEDFNLACDTQYLGATFTGIYMMANGIGGVINGLFCDLYGRKRMFVIGQALFCINLIIPWLPGITSILICRTIGGFGAGCVGDTLSILLMESLVARQRPTISVVVWLPWVFGMAILGGLGFLIRDWRTLYMMVTLPYALIIPAMWMLDESPRWLVTMGKQKEALKVLNKVARWHGKQLPPENEIKNVFEVTRNKKHDEVELASQGFMKLAVLFFTRFYLLIKTPMMRRVTFVSCYNFMAMGLFYFGLSLSGVHYSNDPFLYMVLSGVVDLPSTVVPAPMALRFGRKKSSIFCFAMSGLLLLPLPFVSKDQMWLTMTLALSAKSCGGVAWAVFHLQVTELYPTNMRVLGLAVPNAFVSFTATLAAYIHEILSPLAVWAPSIMFSMCSLVAAAAVLSLPDTSDKTMPNTIAELEEMCTISRSKKKHSIVANDDTQMDLLNGKV
ncbi:unnamed protein product, partial [Meganyctiphanes norvegica]